MAQHNYKVLYKNTYIKEDLLKEERMINILIKDKPII